MIDHQRTIDNIRTVLASAGPASMEGIWAVAVEYADAVETINERLRKCGRLLREGLRSEAIQQCEVEPNLLSLVATLDFPEVSAWTAFLQTNGLAPPSPLLVDVAVELNEAYSQEQPLAVTLRRHRLLALGRSPLRERISTLRKLARLDANNPVWREDLRAYEQARQQEIRCSVDVEYKQKNLVGLEELARDVQSGGWLEPLPPALIRQVCDAHARLLRQRSRAELEELEPQLNDAFSQFDVERGRQLRERWEASAAVVGLKSDDAVFERAAPALDWLDAQDREMEDEVGYQTAVAELEQALDDEESLPNLERMAHAALRYERSLPPILEQRLRTRVAGLELAHSRRLRLVVAAAGVFIALSVAALGYFVMGRRHADQVAAHVNTLNTLVAQNQLEEAQKHLDQLAETSPGVAADAQIQELGVKLASLTREEETRRANFASAIEEAEQASDGTPNRESLETARRLALFDAEKARVLRLETAIAAGDRRQQNARDEKFLIALKALKSRLDAIDPDNPAPQRLSEVRQALAALVVGSKDISASIMAQAKAAQGRVDALYKTIERQQSMQSAFVDLDRGVGDSDLFKHALDEFATAFPESAQGVDFKRVNEEVPLWKTVESWNRSIKAWRQKDVSRLDAADAKVMLVASHDILRDHGGHPAAAELRKRIPHLEAIARRVDDSGAKLHASLNELFSDPLIANLWLVEVVDDKRNKLRYYLITPPVEPRANQSSVQLSYITDFSRNASAKQRVALASITYKGPAPQSTIAKAAMDELAGIQGQLWEQTFVKVIGTIHTSERLDPILKVMLLQKVLEVACQGSESLKIAFAGFADVLGSVPIDPAVPWMDPKSADAIRVRALASDLLKRLPALRQINEQAAVSLKTFKSPPGSTYVWIGWLAQDEIGRWQCRVQDKVPGKGSVFVAQSAGPDKGLAWATIGDITDGQVHLNPPSPAVFVQGRPIFAIDLDRPEQRPTAPATGKTK